MRLEVKQYILYCLIIEWSSRLVYIERSRNKVEEQLTE
jgi:hypothetical protein